MSNYEDPEYGQTCSDIMAKPVRLPLAIPAYRGNVAYDLLAGKELPLNKTVEAERELVLDMTRFEGALVAFLPEKVDALRLAMRRDAEGVSLRLQGTLVGASGQEIDGVFPARIRLLDKNGEQIYSIYRVLGPDKDVELPAPLAGAYSLEVTENVSGKTAGFALTAQPGTEPPLRFETAEKPYIPYPVEIARFLNGNTNALLVLGQNMTDSKEEVERLVSGLSAKGIQVTVKPEASVWRVASIDQDNEADPHADGFHHWHGGYGGQSPELMSPRTVVDSPLIILGAARSSMLLNVLVNKGFVTEVPVAAAGLPVQPTIQVASRGLHWKYDTLCVVANEREGLRAAVDRILADPALTDAAPVAAVESRPTAYGEPEQQEGREQAVRQSAVSFMGNNEYVLDMKFDKAGNIYLNTWGHGDNLYSLDAQGKLRFSRRLPEMGVARLDVGTDRVAAFTAYGSRLYQIGLDGKPLGQAQLTLDVGVSKKGPTYRERPTADLLRHGARAGVRSCRNRPSCMRMSPAST